MILSRSPSFEDKEEAIELFRSLLQNNYNLNECLYFLAFTSFALGKYEDARSYCERVYRELPDSRQIQQLHRAIAVKHKESTQKEQDRAMASAGLIATGIAIAAVGVGFLLSTKRK